MDKIQRDFILGGEWLYYKIYTGTKTADLILTEVVKSVTEELLEKNLIDQWFFIRYGDPDNHIRIRFHCHNLNNVGLVISALHPLLNECTQDDLIWKVQADTYQRELERYGEHTMLEAEKYFFYDSKMIVDFLSLVEGSEGEELRWLFGIRAIDTLLEDFEYTADQKTDLLERMKTGFSAEFKVDKPTRLQMDKKFRAEYDKIKWILTLNTTHAPDYKPILDLLEQKSAAVIPICACIKSQVSEDRLDGMVSSYIHMLMNRLFRSKNRQHELVLYYLLYKTYKVEEGRRKHVKGST